MHNHHDTEEEINQKIYEKAENFAYWQYDVISKYVSGKVIEIGSGNGRITRLLYGNEKVESITGVDTNRKYLKNVKTIFKAWTSKPLTFAYLDISNRDIPPFYRESFDTAISINALEHIKNDVGIIKNCWKLLKKEGRIILLVPALKMLYGESDRAQNHYRRFSRGELKMKLLRGGFAVEEIFPMNFFGAFAWLYHSRILKLRIHRARDIYLFDRFVPLFRFFEMVFPIPFGLSYIAIGKKN